jgi:hypothetical protein
LGLVARTPSIPGAEEVYIIGLWPVGIFRDVENWLAEVVTMVVV